MNQCHFCARWFGIHLNECPRSIHANDKYMSLWEIGYYIGISGAQPDWPTDTTPTMILGYRRGLGEEK